MKQFRLVVASIVLSLVVVFGAAYAGTIAGAVISADKDTKTFVIKVNDEEKTIEAANAKVYRIAGKAGREVECQTEEKEGKEVATKCKVTKAAAGC